MSPDKKRLAQPDYQILFEQTPHPYLVLRPDAKFTIVAVNNRYLEVTHTRRSEMIGRGIFEEFPDNPLDRFATGVADLRSSLERVIRDRAQDIMGVQKYDIPRRSTDEERFEVKYWSPVNTPVFGSDGEINFIIHHVEDITEFILLQQRSSQESVQRLEKVQERADRMEAEVLRRAAEVKDSNRRLKAALEELERSQAELRRLNEKLKELDRAKTIFFGNVSHEFRTPLTLISGPVEDALADAEHPLPPSHRERLEIVQRNALRLRKLVNALLDFSRIEAGRIEATYAPTDLAALTADLASVFRSAIERAGLRLVVDCPPLPEPVYVDRDMWEKIVLNLLSNAFKFTFQGEIVVTLRWANDHVELAVRDTGVGIPREELSHIFERFRLVKGARARSQEGTGIGLALVQELVRLHGGSVTVESVVDEGTGKPHGTTFTVSIPTGKAHLPADRIEAARTLPPTAVGAAPFVEEATRWLPEQKTLPEDLGTEIPAAAEAEGSYLREPPLRRAPAALGGRSARILLADDNADMRDYLKRLLSQYWTVEAVADGQTALAVALKRIPDLVLADVMMPGMDGFELTRALRADPQTSRISILLLTARAGEESRVEGLQAGADDYLIKPFSARELLARVGAHLDLSHLREDARRQEEKARLEAEAAHNEQEQLTTQLRQVNDELVAANSQAREMAEEAQRRAVQLDATNKELEAFTYSVSHDLRAPLRHIDGFSRILLGDFADKLDEPGKRYLQSVRTNAKKMSQLIDDLLKLSRLARAEMHRQPVNLSEMVQSIAAELHEEQPQRQVEFAITPGVVVNGDSHLLRIALENLLRNAWKFTSKQERARIEFGVTKQEGQQVFYVRDNGVGFNMAYADKLFAPFQRLHKEEEFPGTGIGLATVQRIIRRHGGRIWAEGEVGKGATFYFTLL